MQVYLARWVVPISRRPIEFGAVAVHNGQIAWVGPMAEAPSGQRVDLGDSVLLPGLVNAHTHLELTAMRGFLEDLPFRRWIIRLTKARQQGLSRERLLASARAGIAEGLLAGVTTYADTCESGVVHEALRDMDVRGVMYQEVFGPQPEECGESLRALGEKVDVLLPLDTALVRTGVSPHAPYSVSDALFVGAASFAVERELPLAIHAAESDAETLLVRDAAGPFADALRARGIAVNQRATSTIRLLERCGALRARPLLIHCVQVDGDDIARIAANGCGIAHCPVSNAKLGHGIAPLSDFLDAGVRVGLGTDSVASNNRMDLLDESRTAVLMQRVRMSRPDAVPAATALELATRSSAKALGLESQIGSLDVGKSADLAAFPLDAVGDVPAYDPEVTLLFAASGRRARLVTVGGEVRVQDGRLVRDIETDLAELRAAAVDLEDFAREPE